jgi:multiple sugar transport system substrate-binding protein
MKKVVLATGVTLLTASVTVMLALAAPTKTDVRWFVGLGAGTDEPTIAAQKKVVDEFNKSQDTINLKLEIVENKQAYDTLATQITAGNAPDLVGPVGVKGRSAFPNAWADMTPLIKGSNYDLKDYDSALVRFYNLRGQGQIGLPFAVYPSFMMYNKALFDEAGLNYPPATYGQPYVDKSGKKLPWNIETMSNLAQQLTVDKDGNDATSAKFDAKNIKQWGFGTQFTDLRGKISLFGGGNFVDAKGKAVIPAQWREGIKWLQDAMWKKHFYPNGVYGSSQTLGEGNWFDSGNLAMGQEHTWFFGFCCQGAVKGKWALGALPSNAKGKVTAKLHADTFSIPRMSKHKEEAFAVLSYLLSAKVSNQLAAIYGGIPARKSLQESFLNEFGKKKFPDMKINWGVVSAGLKYPDSPNHEEGMPSVREASDRYTAFATKLDNEPTLNVDTELNSLVTDLQKIFDAARK